MLWDFIFVKIVGDFFVGLLFKTNKSIMEFLNPQTWSELQDHVGNFFTEAGYYVEVSKIVDLDRGTKEIDVFVKDIKSPFQPVYLVECKFWNKPVNQETVHSFHRVMNGFGANSGFIVSKSGFQAGCFKAAEKTNIQLVSLKELEEKFYEKWLHGIVNQFLPVADKLFPYWDPSGGKRPIDGKPISYEKQQLLYKAYYPLVSLGIWDLNGNIKRSFPLIIPIINDNLETTNTIIINNMKEYFHFVKNNTEMALKHFKILYREK